MKWSTNDIGVYFSNSLINVNCTSVSNSVLPFTPQLEYIGPDLDNTTGWTQLTWSYTATGGEQFITIGNFKNDASTSYTCVNQNAFNPYSYYFIDDVSVEPGACSAACNLDVTIQVEQEDCVEGGTATLTAVTTNGSGNYGYDWSGIGTGQILTDLGDGTYQVTVTDLNTVGCSSTETITIDVLEPITANAGLNDTICKGDMGQLIASGGASYVWSTGATGSVLNVGPGATTTYTVTATGSNADQATIVVYDVPAVLVEVADQSMCDNSGTIALVANPSGGFFYGPGVSGSTFDPAAAGLGTHVVHYELGDFEDCAETDSVIFTVELCTGLEDGPSAAHISIRPNPSDGIFTVTSTYAAEASVTLEVLNTLGQQVIMPRTSDLNHMVQTFDLSGLSKGIYFLRVSSDERVLNYKLVLE